MLVTVNEHASNMDNINEEWRVIVGYPNYEVSNKGNVRRRLINPARDGREYHLHSPSLCNNGYMVVTLSTFGQPQGIRTVHRLVAKAFVPNPENKPCVDHIDRNKYNNHANNLRWATRSENRANAVAGGYFRIKNGRYMAIIARAYLGLFDSEEEAKNAYRRNHANRYRQFSPYYDEYRHLFE